MSANLLHRLCALYDIPVDLGEGAEVLHRLRAFADGADYRLDHGPVPPLQRLASDYAPIAPIDDEERAAIWQMGWARQHDQRRDEVLFWSSWMRETPWVAQGIERGLMAEVELWERSQGRG